MLSFLSAAMVGLSGLIVFVSQPTRKPEIQPSFDINENDLADLR